MNFSDSLSDEDLPLVIDTSGLISIHSCTFGEVILSTIPNPIILPATVEFEFQQGSADRDFLPAMVKKGTVSIEDTTDAEEELLTKLLTILDDGEAATLTIAISRGYLPIVDERIGRARAKDFQSGLEPGWAYDLIRHPQVLAQLGDAIAIEALYLALRESHMRTPTAKTAEIIALIGIDRAKDCNCLPNFGKLFPSN